MHPAVSLFSLSMYVYTSSTTLTEYYRGKQWECVDYDVMCALHNFTPIMLRFFNTITPSYHTFQRDVLAGLLATLKLASYDYWYPYHDAMSTFPSLFTTGGRLKRDAMNVLKEKNRNNKQDFRNVGSILYVTYQGTKASSNTKITASEYFKLGIAASKFLTSMRACKEDALLWESAENVKLTNLLSWYSTPLLARSICRAEGMSQL